MSGAVAKPEAYPARELDPRELEVIAKLNELKASYDTVQGYVTTTRAIKLLQWDAKEPPNNIVESEVPAGTTLRIVMISKFEDLGLTDDLKEEHDYKVRIKIDSESLSDIRLQPEPSSYHLKASAMLPSKDVQ